MPCHGGFVSLVALSSAKDGPSLELSYKWNEWFMYVCMYACAHRDLPTYLPALKVVASDWSNIVKYIYLDLFKSRDQQGRDPQYKHGLIECTIYWKQQMRPVEYPDCQNFAISTTRTHLPYYQTCIHTYLSMARLLSVPRYTPWNDDLPCHHIDEWPRGLDYNFPCWMDLHRMNLPSCPRLIMQVCLGLDLAIIVAPFVFHMAKSKSSRQDCG